MKKPLLSFGILVCLMGLIQSCQKKDILNPAPTQDVLSLSVSAEVTNQLQADFAKILAKALKADPELRAYLKAEAIKQFDKDYDVLVQLVKDRPISGGASLQARLASYAENPAQVTAIETQLPLLTIYVPTLPSGFSAETWNTQTQIPVVAVSRRGDNNVPYYDATGKEEIIEPGLIPGFPVVVIKENERVAVTTAASASAKTDAALLVTQNEQFRFSFIDASFDGSSHSAARLVFANPPNVPGDFQIDPRVLEALAIEQNAPNTPVGAIWQRDYIYYGIGGFNPVTNTYNTRGPLNRNYKEYIRSMKFSVAAYSMMSDQSEDPIIRPMKPNLGSPSWTEGRYELKVIALTNSRAGDGPNFTRFWPVNPSDLFNVRYKRANFSFYVIDEIIRTEYFPFVDLITWDLEQGSMAWKIYFYENDRTGTETVSHTHSTNTAINFGIDLNFSPTDKVKIGPKFGFSSGSTDTQVHTVTRNLGDDYLGEAILNFSDPVIGLTSGQGQQQVGLTYEITTGGTWPNVSVSIEPHRWR